MKSEGKRQPRAARRKTHLGIDGLERRVLLASATNLTVSALSVPITPASFEANPTASSTATVSTSSTASSSATTSTGTTSATTPAATASIPHALAVQSKVHIGGATDLVALTGPGSVSTRTTKKGLSITLTGTDTTSVLNITQTKAGSASRSQALVISQLAVRSGQIGSINAGLAELNGTIIGLNGADTVTFGSLGATANLDVNGSVNNLTVGNVNLGPNGRIHVAGNVTGAVTLGNVNLTGSKLYFDGSVNGLTTGNIYAGPKSDIDIAGTETGPITLGALDLAGGSIDFDQNVTGTVGVFGTLTAIQGGGFTVGGDLTGAATFGNVSLNGGNVIFDGSVGPLTVGNITVASSGGFNVAGNAAGPVALGNLNLSAGNVGFGGTLSAVTTGAVNLGPSSYLDLAGAVSGEVSLGNLNLTGGEVLLSRTMSSLSTGDIDIANSGQFLDEGNVTFAVTVGNITLGGGSVVFDGTLGATTLGEVTLDGGNLTFGSNLGSLTTGDVVVSSSSPFAEVTLDGGNLTSGSNPGSLATGDLAVSSPSSFTIEGTVGAVSLRSLNLIGGDVNFTGTLSSLAIPGGITVSNNGQFIVTSNITFGVTLGNLNLSSGVVEFDGVLAFPLSMGNVTMTGGAINLEESVGTLTVGDINISTAGEFNVAGSISTAATLGNLNLSAGSVNIGGAIASLTAGNIVLDGGNLNFGSNLGDFSAAAVNVSAPSAIVVSGDVTGAFSLASLDLSGGDFFIDGALTGSLGVTGSLTATAGAALAISGNATGSVTLGFLNLAGGNLVFGGNLGDLTSGTTTIGTGGSLRVAGDASGVLDFASIAIPGGTLAIGRDVVQPLRIPGNLVISNGGSFTVGRDLTTLEVNGNLTIGEGSTLTVGRNLNSMSIQGNLDTSGGGQIYVTGNLVALAVSGVITGHYSGTPVANATTEDLFVGLTLGSLSVEGNIPAANPGTELGHGGVYQFDLEVIKSITGLDIAHGLFNSRITAGISIDGGTPADTFNIGPDGPVAVFDSTITAGVSIDNMTIVGTVESDHATNPAGGFTRIVAGETRGLQILAGGSIDTFQITGNLIDAALAASVGPSASRGTYDAPGGSISGTVSVAGVATGPFTFNNYTAPPFKMTDGQPIDDVIMNGAINPSFIGVPTATNPEPLPTKGTVLGSVISTFNGTQADHAGIFATDTRGVFVGTPPTNS